MNKSELIEYISSRSDRYGDKLIDFMNKNNLTNLSEATEEQLEEYVKESFINKV